MLPVELPCLPLPNVLCVVGTDRVLVQISAAGVPETPQNGAAEPQQVALLGRRVDLWHEGSSTESLPKGRIDWIFLPKQKTPNNDASTQ